LIKLELELELKLICGDNHRKKLCTVEFADAR
jgi:hypothetical protein